MMKAAAMMTPAVAKAITRAMVEAIVAAHGELGPARLGQGKMEVAIGRASCGVDHGAQRQICRNFRGVTKQKTGAELHSARLVFLWRSSVDRLGRPS